MTTLTELADRMDRLELAVGRITDLLERQLAPSPVATQLADAHQQVTAVHGDEVSEQLGQLMVQLGDPQTLASLTRLVSLAPQLEYAAYFAAAGPELLEDALDLTNQTIREQGLEPWEAQQRATRAAETLIGLTDRGTLDVVRRLSGLMPSYLPLVEAAAEAMRQRTEHEGREELQVRMVDALLQLSDPDTQEALVRIATLAPQLEYAAYFAAAGPELLDDVLDVTRQKTEELGLDPHVVTHRLSQATDLLFLFTGTEQIDTLRELGRRAPHFVPVVKASSDVLSQRSEVEGASALQTRLNEAMLELSDPETLESLCRIAALAPKLEYAAYFAAAGPELLDEVTEGVRNWASERGVEGVDVRAGAAVDALVTLSTPATLRGLADVSQILATITETEDAAESLSRLVTRLPRLERTMEQVERALAMVDRSAAQIGLVDVEDLEQPAVTGLKLLKRATEPATMEALETVIELAPDLARLAAPMLRRMAEMEPEAISEMMELLIKPEMLALVRQLDAHSGQLADLLGALAVDDGALRLLRAAQHAASQAATTPPQEVGFWGLLGALRDPGVQRALGIGVTLSKELSSQLDGEAITPR